MERWREVAVAAARQAGAIIATAFRKTDGPENIERKTVLDVVTETGTLHHLVTVLLLRGGGVAHTSHSRLKCLVKSFNQSIIHALQILVAPQISSQPNESCELVHSISADLRHVH